VAKIARYELVRAEAGQADYTFYGGARELARYKGPEAIIHGPAETGKTLGALNKLHLIACKYPDASIVIARKTLTSTYGTVLQTFMGKVLGSDEDAWPCSRYGGEKPEFFTYADTGARIWIAGLDKSSKILSAEHDIIYVNQAEELSIDDWETLTTRATGRAGHTPYAQVIGDANPSYPAHWMYHREGLRLFKSTHEQNPVLFDPVTGQITEQGKRTLAVLDRLTGVRYKRLRLGLPAQAEGAIYDTWSEVDHLLIEEQLPAAFARYVASQDWGFTNPGCLGVWGVDNDSRMYLVAQVYMSRKLLSWWVEQAKRLHEIYHFEKLVCDPSEPANIAEYVKAELPAEAGFNEVRRGIDAVAERLIVQEDGKARLFVYRDSLLQRDPEMETKRLPVSTQEEFPAYVWAETTKREEPVKENDHGMDMVRYAVAYVDQLGRKPETKPASAPPRTVSREQARQLLG
jgi:PBSX family phage terminase large subunit